MTSDGVPCPTEGCSNDALDTASNNAALADDEEYSYFCPTCGCLFTEDRIAGET